MARTRQSAPPQPCDAAAYRMKAIEIKQNVGELRQEVVDLGLLIEDYGNEALTINQLQEQYRELCDDTIWAWHFLYAEKRNNGILGDEEVLVEGKLAECVERENEAKLWLEAQIEHWEEISKKIDQARGKIDRTWYLNKAALFQMISYDEVEQERRSREMDASLFPLCYPEDVLP